MQTLFTKELQLVFCEALNYLTQTDQISCMQKNETLKQLAAASRNGDGTRLMELTEELETQVLDNEYFVQRLTSIREENRWL